jgi:acetoacetate decarboxylase
MTVTGKLTRDSIGQMMPVHAAPVTFESASFRSVDQLAFTYRTETDAAAALLPAQLKIEENPRVAVLFVSYGFSSVGPFREWIQTINVRFRGEDINYVPHIFITNEAGMLAGREREGLPKLLADVDFDTGRVTPEGLITAQLSRPAGFMLARGVFRPSELVKDVSSAEPVVSKMLGLRVFGSAVPGGPLALGEWIPSAIEVSGGEVWSGDGSLTFTGASELSPIHRLPIVGEVQATLLRNASLRLRRATETYPLT